MENILDIHTVLCLNGKEHVFGEAIRDELHMTCKCVKADATTHSTYYIKLFQRFGYYKQSEFIVLCEYEVMKKTVIGHVFVSIANTQINTISRTNVIVGSIKRCGDYVKIYISNACGLFTKKDLIFFKDNQIFNFKNQSTCNCCYYLNKKRVYMQLSDILKCVNKALMNVIGITDIAQLITSYFVADVKNYFDLELVEWDHYNRNVINDQCYHYYNRVLDQIKKNPNVKIEQLFPK